LEILWLGLGLNQKSMPVKRINLFFSPFLDDTKPFVVFQILCRRDLMNTIFAQIEDCCYFARKGKTILVYTFALRRFDFNIWNLYYELLYDCWYKRKRKEIGEAF
jgi:hypothetical protein